MSICIRMLITALFMMVKERVDLSVQYGNGLIIVAIYIMEYDSAVKRMCCSVSYILT